MKIAVYQDLPAGGAKRSIDAIVAILQKDHQVQSFHSAYIKTKAGFLNRLISDFRALVIQRWQQKVLAKQIDQGGFDVVLVTHDRYLQCPWLLRYLITPSVFLCQEPTRAYYEYFLRVPRNLPPINLLYEKLNRYFRKAIEEGNARQADILAANSCYSAEVLFRCYGRIADPVFLGINKEDYFPENIKKLNQILIIGNDEPQKDLGFAIHAVSKIKRNRPQLIIASPRVYNPTRLQKIAKREKVKLQIVFGLDIASLRRLYSTSKITLATAILEPFGLSAIESQACGTPVVAVSDGGFRETVVDNVTGYLTNHDAKALAEACEKILDNPKKAEVMGQAGVSHVGKKFTWDKTVTRLVKLMEDAKNS